MSFDLTIKIGEDVKEFNWIRNHGSLPHVTRWLFGMDIRDGLPKKSYVWTRCFDRRKLLKNSEEAFRLYNKFVDNPSDFSPSFILYYRDSKSDLKDYRDWMGKWVELIRFAQDSKAKMFISD